MTRDEAAELWARYLLGSPLSPEEEQALLSALQDDPALREKALGDFHLHGLLRSRERAVQDAEAFERGVLKTLGAEKDATRFIERVQTKLDKRPTRRSIHRGSRPSWLLAAGLIFGGIILILVLTSGPEEKRQTVRRESRPAPATGQVERVEKESPAEAGQTRREPEPQAPSPRPDDDEQRRKAIAAREDELRKLDEAARVRREEEARLARIREEEARREPLKPPAPAPPGEKPKTQVAVATLQRVEGDVFLITAAGKVAAKEGGEIPADAGLEIGKGRAVLLYADKTEVAVSPNTELRDLNAEGGKRLVVQRGDVRSVIAKQPKDQAMIFASPQGDATVLGTTLRLIVDPDPKRGTRLEVEEGRVQLKNLAGKTVTVTTGQFAVAAVGVEMAATRMPINDILLLAGKGKIAGNFWRLTADADAAEGSALEAPAYVLGKDGLARIKSGSSGFVEFRFEADAEKEYHVWIRAKCVATVPERFSYDCVHLMAPNATWSYASPETGMGSFTSWGFQAGYWWSGGSEDPSPPAPPQQRLTIRFARTGPQVLRLYALESPLRVDAIWISAGQKARPAAGVTNPFGK